jgi:hypothetical protein
MAVARVQFASVSSSGTAPALTIAATGGPGNLLAVHISADGTNNAVPTGVTLSGGSGGTDTLALDVSAASVNPIAGVTLSAWEIPNCTAGHTTITATFAASVAAVLIMAWEVSGAALSAALAAQSGGQNPANTLQPAFDSGAGAGVPAGCFWVGSVTGIGSGGRATPVPSGAWTAEAPLTPGSLTEMLGAYQAGPGGGAPDYAGAFSAPALGAYWAAVTAAYFPAAASGVSVALPVADLEFVAPLVTPSFAATVALTAPNLALAAPAVAAAPGGAATVALTAPNLALAAPLLSPGAPGSGMAGRGQRSDYERSGLLRKPWLW